MTDTLPNQGPMLVSTTITFGGVALPMQNTGGNHTFQTLPMATPVAEKPRESRVRKVALTLPRLVIRGVERDLASLEKDLHSIPKAMLAPLKGSLAQLKADYLLHREADEVGKLILERQRNAWLGLGLLGMASAFALPAAVGWIPGVGLGLAFHLRSHFDLVRLRLSLPQPEAKPATVEGWATALKAAAVIACLGAVLVIPGVWKVAPTLILGLAWRYRDICRWDVRAAEKILES